MQAATLTLARSDVRVSISNCEVIKVSLSPGSVQRNHAGSVRVISDGGRWPSIHHSSNRCAACVQGEPVPISSGEVGDATGQHHGTGLLQLPDASPHLIHA